MIVDVIKVLDADDENAVNQNQTQHVRPRNQLAVPLRKKKKKKKKKSIHESTSGQAHSNKTYIFRVASVVVYIEAVQGSAERLKNDHVRSLVMHGRMVNLVQHQKARHHQQRETNPAENAQSSVLAVDIVKN
jgi:hypothetical protein